jgi:putative colanic acid biosynthesis acetyltransferase WcaF
MTPLSAETNRPLEGGASFSLGNRVLRVIWSAVWLTFCRFTPPPLHPWRALILRLFGARIGRQVRVHGSARIWLPSNLELGDRVLIGPGAVLYNQGTIVIGARTVISQRAHLCASSHDIADPHFQLVLRPIRIGVQCWVAAEAFVGPGVAVGDRAVVGARAALFGDAREDGVYSGNPAQWLKTRELQPLE